jgi:hypothetical protein
LESNGLNKILQEKKMDFTTNDTIENHPNDTNNNNNKVEKNGDVAPVEIIEQKMDNVAVNEMTSKDYYFDSYAHFGIHEVRNI